MDLVEKKSRARLRSKVWRLANPDRYRESIAKCKAAKPEKYRAIHAKWRSSNKKKLRDYRNSIPKAVKAANIKKWNAENQVRRREIANDWRKLHKDQVNALYARRRAAKNNAVPKWANHFFINEAYHLARLRTKVTGIAWSVDHIVPLQSKFVCGLHVEHNLQVIPLSENKAKNNRYWPDM